MSPFQCYYRLIHNTNKNVKQFKGVLFMSNKLSTHSDFVYFGGARGGFSLGVSQFCKNFFNFSIFNDCGAHFSVGKMIYWVGSFGQWPSLIYWVDKVISWGGGESPLLFFLHTLPFPIHFKFSSALENSHLVDPKQISVVLTSEKQRGKRKKKKKKKRVFYSFL